MSAITAITTQVATFELENPMQLRGTAGSKNNVAAQLFDNVIVHVDTDEGVRGSSYVYTIRGGERDRPAPDSGAFLIETATRHLGQSILGEDVFAYNRITEILRTSHLLFMTGGICSLAHSIIDMAIWDAMGKLSGKPLYRMIGAARTRVPLYSTEMMEVWDGSAETYAAKARELVDRGITAMKCLYGRVPEASDIERLEAVRDAVGPNVGLMVDFAVGPPSFNETLRRCRNLEHLNLLWIEDPVSPDRPDLLARLADEIETPIATGEWCMTLAQARAIFDRRAVDLFIFDPGRIGGVTGSAKVVELAEAQGLPVAVHANPEIGVHLAAGFAGVQMMEYLPWWGRLMATPLRPTDDGFGVPSELPGIGADFDLDVIERLRTYPTGSGRDMSRAQ